MTRWYVYRVADLIAPVGNEVGGNGKWFRAVPLPSYPGPVGRLKAAFMVFTGRAHAIQWPEPGDFEKAWRRGMDQ